MKKKLENFIFELRNKLKKPRTWIFLAKFSLPFMFAGIYFIFLFIFEDWQTIYPLMTIYFLPPLGKESVIPIGVGYGIHPAVMAFSIAYVDIVVGLFIALNFDLLKKIPFLGEYISLVERKGKDVLVNKEWLRDFAFYGLIVLVMFPFQGSGAVTASVIGRLMGLKPWRVLLAIIIGALIGCTLIAYSTEFLIYITKLNTIAGLITLAVILSVFYVVYKRFWKN